MRSTKSSSKDYRYGVITLTPEMLEASRDLPGAWFKLREIEVQQHIEELAREIDSWWRDPDMTCSCC